MDAKGKTVRGTIRPVGRRWLAGGASHTRRGGVRGGCPPPKVQQLTKGLVKISSKLVKIVKLFCLAPLWPINPLCWNNKLDPGLMILLVLDLKFVLP